MDDVILSIDAGGASVKFALLSRDRLALLTEQIFYPMPSNGSSRELLDAFRAVFQEAQRQSCQISRKIGVVALSVPGPFDCENGKSKMQHKWASLKGIPLRDAFLAMEIFPEDMEYLFVHDVHAFLLGEVFAGKAAGHRNAAGIIIGTGLGLGIWNGETLLFDDTGSVRYSIFCRPWNDGIAEDYVSGGGIASAYFRKTGKLYQAKDIAELARNGDTAARQVFSEMGNILGQVIADIFKQHDVECVVLGGRVSCAFDLFEQSLDASLRDQSCLTAVFVSEMLETAALKGAAAWAIRDIR